MEYDIHTLLDASTLAATIWVVYMMRFTGLKQAYQKEQDIVNQAFVVCTADVVRPLSRVAQAARPADWPLRGCGLHGTPNN
jgi:hypothetical protein